MGGETQLVERVLRGEEGAFEELVMMYQAPIYYLTLRFVRDEQAAADLAQTTFFRAFQGLWGFRQGASFKTWLYRIAINLCKNYLRDHGKEKFKDWSDIDPPSSANPLQKLIENEEQKLLLRAWGRLPERQRLTLTLRVQEGMKYREIAEVLGCSVGTVKANFHHALIKLKEIFQEG
ncbi:MAG: sigma-70 family RNA polymerase sigma factor [Deltaproteobacteria bacterium]|nr:sigma-70 family RNA polymerase sigma factor [Deltaproteobacteria bacterium]